METIMGVSLRKQKEESISERQDNRTIGKRRHIEPQDLKYPGWLENGGQGQGPNKLYEGVCVLSQEQWTAFKRVLSRLKEMRHCIVIEYPSMPLPREG